MERKDREGDLGGVVKTEREGYLCVCGGGGSHARGGARASGGQDHPPRGGAYAPGRLDVKQKAS